MKLRCVKILMKPSRMRQGLLFSHFQLEERATIANTNNQEVKHKRELRE